MTKKVLVSEKLAEAGLAVLRDKGIEVDVKLKMTPEELLAAIPEYDGLIVRSATKVTREVIEAGGKLRIIGRAGVGVDNVDVEAATERGVIVCNAPTSNIVSAAEHTMALMLACARNIAPANASMHAGVWERAKFTGVELYEKTLAIFGLGRIGGLVAERARAFGMKLIGYDPYCSPERAEQLGVTLYDDVNAIVPLADFITVHLPKTKETIGMFGPEQYAAMKDGVILVNAARGGIFNVDSLADFLAAGKIGAVGLDVYETEPCRESPLHEFENAILTPHLGASTLEAQLRAGVQTAEYVAAGLEGSIVPTALNMAPVPPEVMDTVGPYVPACQMMGSMLSQIHGEVPQFLKLTAAGALANADLSILVAGMLKGLLSYQNTATVTPVNAEAVAKRHGIRIDTLSNADAAGYASTVSIVADGTEVACTLAGEAQAARLVSLLGYKMDIAPASQSLVFEYEDAPGRVGTIGTILGEAGINITTMQIGTKSEERCALAYMNVEGSVDEDVLAKLRAGLADLKNLWCIKL
ncbi:phosphoglycerate dehydrogenase [Paraeggerthella hongkongensis]|uniref:phosphoglycerate dehydrogenase n=1 Tax=Paraeggerthella hominis TaxID=2897351 RepID=UPI001C117DBE|nr:MULTISPECIES: phosphoglycerate dehydrogenase [Paraeggerthella]MBU5404324.1 phosphoglycerate dehydrogenase [Paraeggerthella hongkongensis]MCD2432020.1 phosphoglycerate dehydrogenase [Paraeggerthella hominis]